MLPACQLDSHEGRLYSYFCLDDSRAGSPLLLLSVRALARVRKVRPLSVGPLWLWNFSLTLLCGTVFTMLTLLADLGVGRDHHSLISTVFFLSLV